MIKKKCIICGKEFLRESVYIKRGGGKFCSLKCCGKSKTKKIKKNCLICGKEFNTIPSRIKEGRGKTCSRKCQSIWQSKNLKGKNNIHWKGGGIKRKCEICGKEFVTSLGRLKDNRGKFCSKKCLAEWQSKNFLGEKSAVWKGGISKPYPVDWTRTLRRSIRERDYYTCQLCGKPQGDRAFCVHHINYIKDDCNPKNLVTLCIPCHIRTNQDRKYWTDYFNRKIK